MLPAQRRNVAAGVAQLAVSVAGNTLSIEFMRRPFVRFAVYCRCLARRATPPHLSDHFVYERAQSGRGSESWNAERSLLFFSLWRMPRSVYVLPAFERVLTVARDGLCCRLVQLFAVVVVSGAGEQQTFL